MTCRRVSAAANVRRIEGRPSPPSGRGADYFEAERDRAPYGESHRAAARLRDASGEVSARISREHQRVSDHVAVAAAACDQGVEAGRQKRATRGRDGRRGRERPLKVRTQRIAPAHLRGPARGPPAMPRTRTLQAHGVSHDRSDLRRSARCAWRASGSPMLLSGYLMLLACPIRRTGGAAERVRPHGARPMTAMSEHIAEAGENRDHG